MVCSANNCFPLCGEGNTVTNGNLCFVLGKGGEVQRVLLIYAASLLPSAQNSSYAKWHMLKWHILFPFDILHDIAIFHVMTECCVPPIFMG